MGSAQAIPRPRRRLHTQPVQLNLADLMQRDIPANWSEQRIAFGFL
jgi:hypothetical protein